MFDVHRDVKTAIQHCAWHKTKNISIAVRNAQLAVEDNINYYA